MTTLVLALGAVTVLLLGYIVYQRAQSRGINQQLAEVRWQIDSLNSEEAQARSLLNKPANRDIADQSEFLNELFARKALSWTRVFTEMERIVPPNLHVVSMKPEYTKTNDLMLRVVVATDSRDRAVELVRRMEKSNHFRQPQVVAENVTTNSSDQTAGPGNIQFDIAAIYVPSAEDNDSAADEAKPAKTKEKSGNPRAQSKAPVSGVAGSQSNAGAEWANEIHAREAALMASIREIRKTWMPVVITLVVLDLAGIGYLLSPAGRSRQARQRDYYELRARLTAKRQEVLPTRGMDAKLVQASTDINSFYAQRLPSKYSDVIEELGKVAAETGVHFAGAKYDEKDAPIPGLRKMSIEISLVRRLSSGSEVHQSIGTGQNVLPGRRHRAGRAAGQCPPANQAGNIFA